jgi:hypothetical protein
MIRESDGVSRERFFDQLPQRARSGVRAVLNEKRCGNRRIRATQT